jgi:hypothetical protein
MTAPDSLEKLREALKRLERAYVRLLETGRDRIMDLDGQCDPLDRMVADDPDLRDARDAIAHAERLQGEALPGAKMVPIQANGRMLRAGVDAYESASGGERLPDADGADLAIVEAIYVAMTEAAIAHAEHRESEFIETIRDLENKLRAAQERELS